MPKYIFVTGGVVSALGKGIAAAATGALLEATVKPPQTAKPLGLDADLIARHHGAPEAGFLDLRQKGGRPVRQQESRSLDHRLHEEHTRHDRISGEMSLEMGVADRHILQRDHPRAWGKLQDPIDESELNAVRQARERIPVQAVTPFLGTG